MAVLTIRSHRRYAVRQPVTIGKEGCEPASGLMIELSSEGCRISSLQRGGYSIGDPVVLEIEDRSMTGTIRWSHDGVAGVRLDHALFSRELEEIVARGRPSDLPRYGT